MKDQLSATVVAPSGHAFHVTLSDDGTEIHTRDTAGEILSEHSVPAGMDQAAELWRTAAGVAHDAGGSLGCQYFAACDKPADYLVANPAVVGGWVPTCRHCHAKLTRLGMGGDQARPVRFAELHDHAVWVYNDDFLRCAPRLDAGDYDWANSTAACHLPDLQDCMTVMSACGLSRWHHDQPNQRQESPS